MNTADDLAGQRILVTGASGFVGSQVCRALEDFSIDLHATSRTRIQENKDATHVWKADLLDIENARKLFKEIRPDIVIHLAGYPVGTQELDSVAPTFLNNLCVTVNLLTAAVEVGCKRMVLNASLEQPDYNGSNNTASSPYGASKLCETIYGKMFRNVFKIPLTIVRPFMTYGPRQQERNVIPYVIRSLLSGNTPKIQSGERQIDWIFVDDVVQGVIAAAATPGADGHTLDLGSGSVTSIRIIVDKLVGIINPAITPTFMDTRPRKNEIVRSANIGPSAEILGWKPTHTLDEGLQKTVDWFRKKNHERAQLENRNSLK